MVTTAGPVRRTASATNDWRDSTALAAGDCARAEGSDARTGLARAAARARGNTWKGTAAMTSNPADVDRTQVFRGGKGADAGGFPHRAWRNRAMMGAMD